MNTRLISIVLPTYNGARYLADSIQSCIDQTYTNWELIVVDDCSIDETPDIIYRYCVQDPRIRVIRHDYNCGLPAALNSGFSKATGNYYTWTSDDNRYRPQALGRMLEFLSIKPHVSIVYCDFSKIDQDGNLIQYMKVDEPEGLAVGNCIGACFLYRKEVSDLIGNYSEALCLAEDYDFWLRASLVSRFAPFHEDLYVYRLHKDTLTHTKLAEIIEVTTKTLALNLPNMNWLPDQSRGRGFMRLFHAYPISTKPFEKAFSLLQALFYSPLETSRCVIFGLLKAVIFNTKSVLIK
jgi:glycosyltransferase involved in cell wall biosynthesis